MALPSTPRLYRIPKKKFAYSNKKGKKTNKSRKKNKQKQEKKQTKAGKKTNRSLTYKTTDQG